MQSLAQGVALLRKMLERLQQPREPEIGGFRKRSSVAGTLTFDNVSFSYRRDRAVLRQVSFEIPSGRTLAVVGTSGAGKSTILCLLLRLYEPDEGPILLNGASAADMQLSHLRDVIAVVPQDTVLFNDTIFYNIALGKAGCTTQDVVRAAKLAHIHDFIVSLPDGYDTKVGERGVKLSGGEKQRIAIARAVIRRPQVYVFDEATSSLDSATEREILSSLNEISKGTTTLIIAHRLSTVVHANEILVLEGGTVIERGNHGKLLEAGGRYAMLWWAQQSSTHTRFLDAETVIGITP